MVKVYRCNVCNKEIKEKWRKIHDLIEMPVRLLKSMGDKMTGKMIIKDGKLVKADEVPQEQVVEETKQKVFSKQEEAPKPQPVEQEQLQPLQKAPPTQNAAPNPEQDAMYQEYLRMREAEMEKQRQEMLMQQQQQQVEEKVVSFVIVLNNGIKTILQTKESEAQGFYEYIEEELSTKPVLKIENKIIPVSAVSLVYFE